MSSTPGVPAVVPPSSVPISNSEPGAKALKHQANPKKAANDGITDFLAGTAGGMVQVLTGHPFDTIKVRLQTSSAPQSGGAGGAVAGPQFNGALDCLRKTIASEGWRGLFKGMSSPLIGVSFLNAILFFNYGAAQNLLRTLSSPRNSPVVRELTINEVLLAGMIAGAGVAFVEGPVDLFKAKMQVQFSSSSASSPHTPASSMTSRRGGEAPTHFKNAVDVAVKLFRYGGIRSIYQGLLPTLLRNIPANGIYFACYEASKRWFRDKSGGGPGSTIPSVYVLLSGGIGGMMYWISCYPIDLIKSKLQTDHVDPMKRKYSGVLECTVQTLKKEGMKGLFRGFTPCLLRSFPANAACFMAYEAVKSALAPK